MARPRTVSDEAVLAAAVDVIETRGVQRLTLSSVAAAVGLAPATLVQRFGSKQSLLVAIGRHAVEHAGDPFERQYDTGLDALDVLVEGLAELASGIRSRMQLARHLGFVQLDLTEPEIRAPAVAHAAAVRERIVALLRVATDAGELSGDVDHAALARSVHVAYHGALLAWGLAEDPANAPDSVRADVRRVLVPYMS